MKKKDGKTDRLDRQISSPYFLRNLHLLVQSQQWKHQKLLNIFATKHNHSCRFGVFTVNSEKILHIVILSIVHFKQGNTDWVLS